MLDRNGAGFLGSEDDAPGFFRITHGGPNKPNAACFAREQYLPRLVENHVPGRRIEREASHRLQCLKAKDRYCVLAASRQIVAARLEPDFRNSKIQSLGPGYSAALDIDSVDVSIFVGDDEKPA